MMQIAEIPNTHPAGSPSESCHVDDNHWWLMFEDGECHRNDHWSRTRSWTRAFDAGQVFHQTVAPRRRVVSLSPQTGRNTITELSYSGRDFLRASDGRRTLLQHQERTIHGEEWPQFSYRVGWEWKSPRAGPPLKLDERAFIRALRISQTSPARPIYKGAIDAPLPASINFAQSCNEAGSLFWEGDRAPR